MRERERQTERAGSLRAVVARAEHPHRGLVATTGHRGDLRVGAVEEHEEVAQLLRELVDREACRAAAQRRGRHRIGAGCPPDSEIDAPGMQRLEHPELLGDDERRVVREHHAARTDADRLGRRREMGDQNRRRRSSRCPACCGARQPTGAGNRGAHRGGPARPRWPGPPPASCPGPREPARESTAADGGIRSHSSDDRTSRMARIFPHRRVP